MCMQAITLFNQNFAVAESLMQLYQLFNGLQKKDLREDLRLAVCALWNTPTNAALHHASNDRVLVLARSLTTIPEYLSIDNGLDFLLRQAVVVACTALESFFWDVLRENVLTVVRARRSNADESITSLKFTLGDYISLQQYDDQELRLKQLILNNFKRSTLYDDRAFDNIAKILTVRNFWKEVERITGESEEQLKKKTNELVQRRNQIAHRADRPDEEKGEEADVHGLRPISHAWTNQRIQTAKTIVSASAELFDRAIRKLEDDIRISKEQEEARKLARQAAKA